MKKFLLLILIAAIVFTLAGGCTTPTLPVFPTKTPTISATITPTATQSAVVSPTVTPTESDTFTVTETHTELPTLTETLTDTVTPTFTGTPVVYAVDNFESGVDSWTTLVDGGALSNVRSGLVGTSNPASYGAYALGVTGEAWAEIGSGPYTGFSSVQKSFGPVDLSAYASLDFAIAEKITFVPYYGGPVSYKMKIKSGSNLIEASISAPPSTMTNHSLPLSSFALPSGAGGYTAASVLANADGIIFEVSINAAVFKDWIGYEIYLDNIEFKM